MFAYPAFISSGWLHTLNSWSSCSYPPNSEITGMPGSCGAEDGTQGFVHSRQTVNWATPSASPVFNILGLFVIAYALPLSTCDPEHLVGLKKKHLGKRKTGPKQRESLSCHLSGMMRSPSPFPEFACYSVAVGSAHMTSGYSILIFLKGRQVAVR